MTKLFLFIVFLTGWFSPASTSQGSLESQEDVVRAVLFYSPTCGHCHYVIQEVLPPLIEKYGDQLQILGLDVSQPGVNALFAAALEPFDLELVGVPALIVGDQLMIGSVDIPEKFPGLIEQHLAQGGVDWPDIPGLAEVLPVSTAVMAEPTATRAITPTPTAAALMVSSSAGTSLGERFGRDPKGNTLAVIVLAGMIAALVGLVIYLSRRPEKSPMQSLTWLIPLLCVAGLGVAGYLTYVETTRVSAVCGPVGDCNTVQQSEYARIFGVLPIGMLGLVGYAVMGIAWVLSRSGKERAASMASLALFSMSVLGVLFSIYLTFLEPFVIGATCAWCLTSAVLMTGLMWLTARPGVGAWRQLQGRA